MRDESYRGLPYHQSVQKPLRPTLREDDPEEADAFENEKNAAYADGSPVNECWAIPKIYQEKGEIKP